MKIRRLIFFFLTILVGVGAGLVFGWLIMPPQRPVDASLTQLRADFKTDWALMVAERFESEQNPIAALDRLALIDESDPPTLLGNVLHYAQGIGYPSQDLSRIEALLKSFDSETLLEWQQRSGGDAE